jgi:hypothetical protein
MKNKTVTITETPKITKATLVIQSCVGEFISQEHRVVLTGTDLKIKGNKIMDGNHCLMNVYSPLVSKLET